MNSSLAGPPIAIFAGRGQLPVLLAAAAARRGRAPVILAIAGESDPTLFGSWLVHVVRWGDLGRIFRIAGEAGCREAVFIGGIERRPDLASIRPDIGGIKLIPQIVRALRRGDDGLLSSVASVFERNGLRIISPLDLDPELTLAPGLMVGPKLIDHTGIEKAAEAARAIGQLDIGHAAVAVGGRVVALEDVGGTDALLQRVAVLRQKGRIPQSGGVLVKCMKPNQDRRIDLPTLGPDTAKQARAAGLDGVAAEAGRSLLAGRAETFQAFRESGLFLFGLKPPDFGRD